MHRGRLSGTDWVPTTAAELDDYVADMRLNLSVNAQTREFVDFPPTSPFFPDLPAALDHQVHRMHLDARRIRWAFGTPRVLEPARRRAAHMPTETPVA